MTRRAIYNIVSGEVESTASRVYAVAMICVIVISLVPLCFHDPSPLFVVVDFVCVTIFIIDYILRWATADLKLDKGRKSFALYPFTPMAIIDLLSIIPFFIALNSAWRALRLVRLLSTLRAFRLIRFSKGLSLIIDGVLRQIVPLLFVLLFAVAYVLVTALVAFHAEPEIFTSYFDAVYWSVITLTTVGYGDLYPVTTLGRVISALSSFIGVLVIALPASIITAGIMEELAERRERERAEAELEMSRLERKAMRRVMHRPRRRGE